VEVVAVPAERSARRAAARSAASALLARIAGVPGSDVRISAVCPDCGGDHGRPIVTGTDGSVSVAHPSAGIAVIAASVAHPAIGVDAEPDTAAARARAAEALPGREDALRDWVRIEAALKADGRGLRVDPETVLLADGVATVPGGSAWRIDDVALPGLVAAVATPPPTHRARASGTSSSPSEAASRPNEGDVPSEGTE
jgi:4'-phosphopantetheinyl transferase